jgi:hypothetical protein
MSANSAVIVLRSPSDSSSVPTGKIAADAAGCSLAPSAPVAVERAAPQSPQKRLESGFSAPHLAQRMMLPHFGYMPSSSSNAFASFRSAVSKPSVNQL